MGGTAIVPLGAQLEGMRRGFLECEKDAIRAIEQLALFTGIDKTGLYAKLAEIAESARYNAQRTDTVLGMLPNEAFDNFPEGR